MIAFCFILFQWMSLLSGMQTKADTPPAVAFPGAEGYGKYTVGGRGGKVFIVSNLEDSGPGSLRAALSSKEKRIVVFSVAGTIHLQSKLIIPGNCTIAGQSAPGDGICIADQPVSLGGDQIIIQYLRFRLGDRFQNKGMVDGSGSDDALGGTRRKHIIIDHCSITWSTDECFSIYAGDSTTLQWNLIAEPLNYSYHFETGDKDFEQHGYGGIWGGRHLSAHHNLFAHCNSRTPRFDGIRNAESEFVDFRNNVLYNWGHNNVYAGEGGRYNIINNYYKPGPNTEPKLKSQFVNPGFRKDPFIPFGQYFVHGNYMDANPKVSASNQLGVRIDASGRPEEVLVAKSFPAEAIPTVSAEQAYAQVLEGVGASHRRDSLDERIIRDVQQGKGRFIDVQGGYAHGTAYDQTITAWPYLAGGASPKDSDQDGMPDHWEQLNGLNMNDPRDATMIQPNTGYCHLELYLHSLIRKSKKN
jgi:pectate lyase